jgi:hypothetical protein
METFRDKWLRFGCFLTGFNYLIVRSCSELSRKRVIKYTSSLLIICLLWAFIGFAFTGRYLKGEWYACAVAMVIMVFLIIQIERQVILSSKDNRLLHGFRFVIAMAMALIGTVIIDQIIFREDIDKRKMLTMDAEVKKIFPGRAEELKKQIDEITLTIEAKELERKAITDDVTKSPFVPVYERTVQRDTALNESVTITKKSLPNPKVNLLGPLDKTIAELRLEKNKKDGVLLGLRPVIENELKQNVGFLDELAVMYSLLSESGVSFSAWFIWFVFLLGLELLILASKIGESENDYDKMMEQQMQLHFLKIQLLAKRSSDT